MRSEYNIIHASQLILTVPVVHGEQRTLLPTLEIFL